MASKDAEPTEIKSPAALEREAKEAKRLAITVRIPEPVRRRLYMAAGDWGQDVQDIVAEALDKHLPQYPPTK